MSKKLPFSPNLYLNLNSLIQIRNLSQPTQTRQWFDQLQSLFRGTKISWIKLLLCIKELNELLVFLSAIFPSEGKTMDLKLKYKYIYIYINPFSKTLLFEKIYLIFSIYIYFIFLSQGISVWWVTKRYICLIYIFKFERFLKNGYLHICMKPKETQSCKRGLIQVRICLDKQVSS